MKILFESHLTVYETKKNRFLINISVLKKLIEVDEIRIYIKTNSGRITMSKYNEQFLTDNNPDEMHEKNSKCTNEVKENINNLTEQKIGKKQSISAFEILDNLIKSDKPSSLMPFNPIYPYFQDKIVSNSTDFLIDKHLEQKLTDASTESDLKIEEIFDLESFYEKDKEKSFEDIQ